jgi:hypothetical protein
MRLFHASDGKPVGLVAGLAALDVPQQAVVNVGNFGLDIGNGTFQFVVHDYALGGLRPCENRLGYSHGFEGMCR